jgi:transcription-repair coupling factor (superfamily II helicase)
MATFVTAPSSYFSPVFTTTTTTVATLPTQQPTLSDLCAEMRGTIAQMQAQVDELLQLLQIGTTVKSVAVTAAIIDVQQIPRGEEQLRQISATRTDTQQTQAEEKMQIEQSEVETATKAVEEQLNRRASTTTRRSSAAGPVVRIDLGIGLVGDGGHQHLR